jgi:hypothetical protein
VAAKFTPDPQLYVVYWSEVEHDDPRAGTVEEQGNTRKIYASSRMTTAAERGEAITAWNRWGHNRPRAWLAKYPLAALSVPPDHVLRDFTAEAKEMIKRPRPPLASNDPRMFYAP